MRNSGIGSWPERRARISPGRDAIWFGGATLSTPASPIGSAGRLRGDRDRLRPRRDLGRDPGRVHRARTRAGLSADGARAALRDRLAGFKVPRYVRLVGELPKTAAGKVRKPDLRAEYAKIEEN